MGIRIEINYNKIIESFSVLQKNFVKNNSIISDYSTSSEEKVIKLKKTNILMLFVIFACVNNICHITCVHNNVEAIFCFYTARN